MLDILIDGDGKSWPVGSPEIICRVRSSFSGADVIECVLSHLGFVRIQMVGEAIIISLQPRLVRPITMTNAFRTIVDRKPACIFVYAHMTYPQSRVFTGISAALDWIERLVAAQEEP